MVSQKNFEKAYLIFKEGLKNLFDFWKSHVLFLRLLILLCSISNHSIKSENCDTLISIGTQIGINFHVYLDKLMNTVMAYSF